jgi:pimeloyl-ACP methyl ester carboxylesterase
MCWSNGRVVDAPFPDWLREINIALAALRSAGARRIVVAGQSMGGLAAIIYGVQHPDVAGVIAIAPAGAPGTLARFPDITESIAKAHQMIAAGQGGQRTTCADINAGSTISVAGTPTVYLSFVEPGGLADFPQQLPALRVPIIWIAGTLDRTQQRAAAMDATIPANPLTSFVQVTAAHLQTPAGVCRCAAVDWLKTLPVQ